MAEDKGLLYNTEQCSVGVKWKECKLDTDRAGSQQLMQVAKVEQICTAELF